MAILNNLIVNGAARFLNLAYFNRIQADILGANEGYFNFIKTVDGEVTNKLSVNDLSTVTARVVESLTVDGEIHSNNWTVSNIAAVDGNFMLTPTVSNTTALLAINIISTTGGVNTYKLTLGCQSGSSFAVVQVPNAAGTGKKNWPIGSKVLVTGDVTIGNMTYPLGTCQGVLYTALNATGCEVVGVQSKGLDVLISEVGAFSGKNANIKISIYQTAPDSGVTASNNTVTVSNAALYRPIGILLTAKGTSANSTFIDIYGGVNDMSHSTTVLSAQAEPNVRIGNLEGLPNIISNDQTNNEFLPTGWGIYTDNGFFKGTIVSTSGRIGSFILDTALHAGINGGPTSISGTTAGTYVGTDGFLNYNSGTQYVKITGGVITAQGANIQGVLNAGAGSTIGPWTITSSSIYKGNATYGNASGMYFGDSGLSLGSAFQVTSAGVLTATGADLTGKISATSGSIGGWQIGTDTNKSLHNGSVNTSPTPAANVVILSKGITTTSAIGNLSAATYSITAGTTFGVTTNGVLTATSGRIGKFNLTNTYLSTGSGSTMAGMGGNQAFWAGNSSSDNAPFRVSYAGVLGATGATLTNLTIKNSATGTPTIGTFDTNGITLYDQAGTQRIKITSSGGVVIGKASGKGRIEVTDSGMNIYNASGTQTSSFGDSITLGSNAATVTIGKVAANNYNTVINNQGMTINDNATPIAQFSSSGARIGKTGVGYIDIKSTGLDVYSGNNNVNLVHFGYDSGTDSEGGTSIAPYYTLGTRKNNSAIGNFSIAEGLDTAASGHASHAEGFSAEATGYQSHAEGSSTLAEGESSHAEGAGTWAKGDWSHAEGGSSYANGDFSHAGGNCCKAESNASFAMGHWVTAYGPYQTAIGKYNKTDTSKAFIIGNGTGASESARSNALTVDWDGNVNIASGAKYKINGTNLAASDVGALSSSGGTVSGNLTVSGIFKGQIQTDTNTLPQFSGAPAYLVGIEAFASGGTMKWQSTGNIRVGYANNLVLPGAITMYAGSTAPTGWLLCDGSAVSRTTYSELYAVIGTTYGSGNGSSTFNLPDLRGRAPIGAGTGSGLTARTLGTQNIGSENAIIPYHRHSVSAVSDGITGGSHNHDMRRTQSATATSGSNRYFASGSVESGFTTSSETHTHNLPAHNTNYAGTSGNTTGANMQPSAVVNFIICTGKTS